MSTLADLLAQVGIAPEQRAGYDRDDWKHWVDDDRDGLDTRQEVLAAESLDSPTIDGGRVGDGRWVSFYDGQQTSTPGDFDVDHVVALGEAHESGGWAWDTLTRQLYANDLSFPDHLIAVSASSNRSKGARDPAEWLPPNPEALCTYLAWWTSIKVRWQLTMDQTEYDAIARHAAADCADTLIDLEALEAGAAQPVLAPPPTPASTAPPTGPDCHPAYEPCLPVVDDLNCSDVRELGKSPVTVITIGVDPYRLDGNSDGIACA